MFALSIDVGLLYSNMIYKGVFKFVGNVNNEFKLAKIRTLCGSTCQSALLSKIYEFGKTLFVQGIHNAEDLIRDITP